MYALAARCARALDEGEPLPNLPNRLLEENRWRATRYGLAGELVDFDRGEAVPARSRIEQLHRVGCAGGRRDRRVAVPRGSCCERGGASDRTPRRRRDAAGDLRRAGRGRRANWLTGDPGVGDLFEQIRGLKLSDFLLSTAMTLASLAYGKLGAGELAEARLAIDALAALVPLARGRREARPRPDAFEPSARLRGRCCQGCSADSVSSISPGAEVVGA